MNQEISSAKIPAIRLRRFDKIPSYVIALSVVMLFLIATFWILFAMTLGIGGPRP